MRTEFITSEDITSSTKANGEITIASGNPLKIDLRDIYKVKIEEPKDLENSFFKEIYLKAGNATAEILNNTLLDALSENKNGQFKHNQEYNNIIAFCGERGTGKSSAMISFTKALIYINEASLYSDISINKDLKLKDFRYESLDIIDPSLFEKEENIFEVVLAQLFSAFEKKLESNEHKIKIEKKRRVLELFEKVYENLQTIKNDSKKYNGEALETLSKLACGANLRNNFKELITEYLNVTKTENISHGKACLIIPIDDFDLNVKAVAEMAEQIRKYLMIPKVIILMAADLNQLGNAITQTTQDNFKTIIRTKESNGDSRSIARYYVQKLLPEERRLQLPQIIDNALNLKITLIDEQGIEKNSNSLQDLFLELLYRNAGILFTKQKNRIHNIIPLNLRGVMSWLKFLTRQGAQQALTSIEAFSEFFSYNYCRDLLNPSFFASYEVIDKTPNEILNTTIIDELRKTLKEYGQRSGILHSIFKDTETPPSEVLKEIKLIIESGNYSHNVSLGDIIFLLNTIEKYNYDSDILRFIFCLKTLLTIRLKGNILSQNLSDFNSLIGGSIYNTKDIELFRGSKSDIQLCYDNSDKEGDRLLINGKSLQEIQTEVVNEKRQTDSNLTLEWLHYFLIRLGGNDEYRSKEKQPYYLKSLNIDTNVGKSTIAKFDILAPIILVENYKKNFDRLYPSILLQIPEENIKRPLIESSFAYAIEDWKGKDLCHFPFESVEQINYIFENYDTDYKEKEKREYIHYFRNSINQILKGFKTLNETQPFYEIQDAKLYFESNPIYSAFINVPWQSITDFLLNEFDDNISRKEIIRGGGTRGVMTVRNNSIKRDLINYIVDIQSKIKSSYSISEKKGKRISYIVGQIIGSKGLMRFVKFMPEVSNLIGNLKVARTELELQNAKVYDKNEVAEIFSYFDKIISDWYKKNI